MTDTPANQKAYQDALTWQTNPDPQSVARLQRLHLPADEAGRRRPDAARWSPVTTDGNKYLLSPALIEGTQIDSASAGAPGSTQGQVHWTVNLQLDGKGSADRSSSSRRRWPATEQAVRDRPRRPGDLRADFESVITNGTAQISGNFTESSAKSLATSLKYGALPISFDKNDDHDPGDRPVARR